MCGLVGIAGKLAYKDEALMRRLLVFDYFRGTDSTGLAAIRGSNKEVKIAKIASHPIDLFDTQRFKEALNGNTSEVFLGHNRAATRGNVNAVNAHPYQFDHIVGAHNGTLDHSSFTALEKALDEKFPVDSMAIFAAIAKLGIRETISLLQGAWSIVYYDLEKGTINFIRNKERPMYYGYNKEFDRLFWASEWPTIDDAVRTGSDHEFYSETKTGHRFWPTEIDTHYTWDVSALKAGSKTMPKPKVSKMEGKPPTPVSTYSNEYGYWSNGTWVRKEGGGHNSHDPFQRRTKGTQSSTTKSHGTNNEPAFIHVLGDLDNPFGGIITRERFDEIAKFGCAYCSADVTWGEQGVTIIDKQDIVLCVDCSPSQKNSTNRVYLPDLTQHMITVQ